MKKSKEQELRRRKVRQQGTLALSAGKQIRHCLGRCTWRSIKAAAGLGYLKMVNGQFFKTLCRVWAASLPNHDGKTWVSGSDWRI